VVLLYQNVDSKRNQLIIDFEPGPVSLSQSPTCLVRSE
jgi:hypothetical protein